MTFGYKNTEAAMHAYTATLQGLKLGQGFFSQLNLLYAKLIIELFKCLFETKSLNRMDEFKADFEMFAEDMIRKYSSTSRFRESPRSPHEKRMGIAYSEDKKVKSSYHRNIDTFDNEYTY